MLLSQINIKWMTLLSRKKLLVFFCSRIGVSFNALYITFQLFLKEIFAIINQLNSNMEAEIGKMIEHRYQKLFFFSLCQPGKYTFLKQHYRKMMPEKLQSHLSVFSFYTIYAAFHLFMFKKEKFDGVHDIREIFFISA